MTLSMIRTASRFLPFFLLMLAFPVFAQPLYETHLVERGFSPEDIATCDYDDDGDVDLVIQLASGEVLLYRNTATGWEEDLLFTSHRNGHNLEVSDVDGDGDLDFYVLDIERGLFWYERDGDEYVPHLIDADGMSMVKMGTGDVDNDGDPDIYLSFQVEGTFGWYENTGTGNWPWHVVSDELSLPTSAFLSDLDNDGDADFVSSSLENGVHWHEATLDGWVTHGIAPYNETIRVVAGDLDNDGDVDILAAHTSFLRWYELTNSGYIPHTLLASIFSPKHLITDDMDGDGDLDILASWGREGLVYYFEHQPDGFANVLAASDLPGLEAAEPGDFDDDGVMDFATIGRDAGLSVWTGAEDLTWDAHLVQEGFPEAWIVTAGDYDGDDDVDFISSHGATNLVFWENTGQEWVRSTLMEDSHFLWSSPLLTVDLDDDGRDEFISGSWQPSPLQLWDWTPDGWMKSDLGPSLGAPSALDLIDYDNDGDTDILTTDMNDAVILVNSEGVYNEIIIDDAGNWVHYGDFHPIDFDGNGLLDVAGVTSAGAVQIITDAGNLVFVNAIGDESATAVHCRDLDGDGDYDILAGGYTAVVWFEQTTPFTFVRHDDFPALDAVYSFDVADLDGDDAFDVLLTCSDKLYQLEQSASGWEINQLHAANISYFNSDVIDIDRDGDNDILVGTLANGLFWLEQTGNGVFVERHLDGALPARFALAPAYPNPFNPSTTLSYSLDQPGHTRLAVYDMLGREVARLVDATRDAGHHAVSFDASALATGTYFARLSAEDGRSSVQRLILMK